MIYVQDLRVGNYYRLAGKVIKAKAEDIVKCQRAPSLRRPIILTPSLLRRCGLSVEPETGILEETIDYSSFFFPVTIGGIVRRKQARWVTRDMFDDEIVLEKPFLRIDGITDVYHLHHLQNIYYDLNLTELNIDLLEEQI